MAEEWRSIAGFPAYEVSDHGRVRRVIAVKGAAAKVLKPSPDAYGYLQVGLCNGRGLSRNRKLHQLVLEAFVGPRPDGYECAHGDCDKQNNHVSNLRWATKKENRADSIRMGRLRRISSDKIAAVKQCEVFSAATIAAIGVSSATYYRIKAGLYD